MYMITALIGESAWTLTFQHPDGADKAYKSLDAFAPPPPMMNGGKLETLEIEDDFGLKVCLHEAPRAIQRSDCAKAFDGQSIIGLFQARAQGKLQAMAARDPQLSFLNGVAGQAAPIIRPSS